MSASPAPGGSAVRRDVRFYWWGQTASAFGTSMTAIALPVVALTDLGATAGDIGVLGAAATLPGIVLGLPAGALADRITRPRRAMMLLDTGSALALAVLAVGVAHHLASLVWLVVLGAVQGFIAVLLGSLYFLHLRHLVGTEALGPARARLQAGQYGAALLGRIAAGPVIALAGSAAALATDAASYLLSALALLAMRSPDRTPRRPGPAEPVTWRTTAAGLTFFTRHPFHRLLVLFITVPAAALTGSQTLTGPFLLRTVHLPVSVYGLAFVLSGVMGLTGSAVAARVLRPGSNPRAVTLTCFAAALPCSLLLPLAGGPLPVAVSCAALGLGLPIFFGAIANVALTAVLAADVAEQAMGRATAALQVIVSITTMVGALAAGALGDRVGVRTALWLLGASALVAVLLAGPPALRAARALHLAPGPAPAPGRARTVDSPR